MRYERYGAEEMALYELVMNGSGPLCRRALESAQIIREGAPFGEPWRTIAREMAEGLMRSGWADRAREVMESAGAAIPADFGAIAERLRLAGHREGLIGGQLADRASMAALMAEVERIMASARHEELTKLIPDETEDWGW